MAPHSRSIDFRSKPFEPYTKAMGELALVWNDLHENLSMLFQALLPIANQLIPDAIWYSHKSDRGQRDMIAALVNLRAMGHDIPEECRDEITWLLGQVNSLEDMRNDALHSPMFNSGNDVFPIHELGHKRAKKLAKKDILFEFGWFYDSAVVLREYAAELSWYLPRKRLSEPLPERPSLPNRGQTGGTKPRPQETNAKRPRRP